MKRIRFANVTTVWNWSYKPIYMLVFKKDLSCNMFHFNDSINTWNSCAQFLKKEIIMKCLAINIFAWNFLTNANSKNIIAILRIVTTEKSELTFLNSCKYIMRQSITWSCLMEIWLERVTRRSSVKKITLKISKNLQ